MHQIQQDTVFCFVKGNCIAAEFFWSLSGNLLQPWPPCTQIAFCFLHTSTEFPVKIFLFCLWMFPFPLIYWQMKIIQILQIWQLVSITAVFKITIKYLV